MSNDFYIYEHWRSDQGVCFYVGKGKGKRAWSTSGRNQHHTRIRLKLKKSGHSLDVRVVETNLTQGEAFNSEKERIAFWRAANAPLVNQTCGGDGVVSPTDDVRAKMRESQRKRWESQEARLRMSEARKAFFSANPDAREKLSRSHRGKKISSDHREALLAGNVRCKTSDEYRQKITGAGNHFFGKSHSEETRTKISMAKIGTSASAATRQKMSLSRKGKTQSKEWVAARTAAMLATKAARKLSTEVR